MLIGLRTRSQLAFLEVSLGNYDAAWTAVEPLLVTLETLPAATEIATAMFVPDAIEAAITTGRQDVAEWLIDLVETNGRRVDRAWMLAVAARGRGIIAATDGDLDAAHAALMRAMAEHDRLPMPFERARTQLVLGHVLRRQRAKDDATSVLHEALSTFETLGSPLWAERVRAELTPTSARRPRQTLTEAETRTSRHAASGLTNPEIAAALFISQKTVEATLARSYRKLGIRNRSELGPKLVAEDDA